MELYSNQYLSSFVIDSKEFISPARIKSSKGNIYMQSLQNSHSKTNTVMALEVPLTMDNIFAIKESLISSIEKTSRLIINHENSESIDLSYIQLLISFVESAVNCDQSLLLDLNVSDAYDKFIGSLGLQSCQIQLIENEFNNEIKISEKVIG